MSEFETNSSEFSAELERIEARGFGSWFRAGRDAGGMEIGVDLIEDDDFTALFVEGLDVLALNRVLWLGLDRPASETTVERLIEEYSKRGIQRFFVTRNPAAEPRDADDPWRHAGLATYNEWQKLYRFTENAQQSECEFPIRPVEPDQRVDVARMLCTAFEWGEHAVPWIQAGFGSPGWNLFGAFDGDTMAGCGAIHLQGDTAYFGPAATREEYQRRGIQSALIDHRVNFAHQSGCRLVTVETGVDSEEKPNTSFRNLVRHGFEAAYRRTNYLWEAGPRSSD